MFFQKVITAIKCDRCEEEINPMFPQTNFENEHHCWDCSYIKGFVSEWEYLESVGGIDPEGFRATIRNGEIIVWSGNTPPWEAKPSDERRTKKYKDWRKSVLDRDKHVCRKCGSKNELHAHHIKEFAKYPDLRYSTINGLTVCKECHIKIHRRKEVKNK